MACVTRALSSTFDSIRLGGVRMSCEFFASAAIKSPRRYYGLGQKLQAALKTLLIWISPSWFSSAIDVTPNTTRCTLRPSHRSRISRSSFSLCLPPARHIQTVREIVCAVQDLCSFDLPTRMLPSFTLTPIGAIEIFEERNQYARLKIGSSPSRTGDESLLTLMIPIPNLHVTFVAAGAYGSPLRGRNKRIVGRKKKEKERKNTIRIFA